MRRGQLAEEHGDQLLPAGKAFGRPLRPQTLHGPGKIVPVDQRNNLCKYTGNLYHSSISGQGFSFYG
jgi:hypothetical protein